VTAGANVLAVWRVSEGIIAETKLH